MSQGIARKVLLGLKCVLILPHFIVKVKNYLFVLS